MSNRRTNFAKIAKCFICSPEFASMFQRRILTWLRPPKWNFFSLLWWTSKLYSRFLLCYLRRNGWNIYDPQPSLPKVWMNEESHSKLYVMPLAFSHCVFSSMVCLSGAIAPKSKVWMNEESHSKLYVMPLAFSHCVFPSMVCLSGAIAPKSKQTLTQMPCSFQSASRKSRICF